MPHDKLDRILKDLADWANHRGSLYLFILDDDDELAQAKSAIIDYFKKNIEEDMGKE